MEPTEVWSSKNGNNGFWAMFLVWSSCKVACARPAIHAAVVESRDGYWPLPSMEKNSV